MGLIQAVHKGVQHPINPGLKELQGVSRILIGADGIDVVDGDIDGLPCRALVLTIQGGYPQVVIAIPKVKCGEVADALAGITGNVEVVRDLEEWLKGV